jgi:hypothetical protein
MILVIPLTGEIINILRKGGICNEKQHYMEDFIKVILQKRRIYYVFP